MQDTSNAASSSDEAAACIEAARMAIQHHDFGRAEEELQRAVNLGGEQPAIHNLFGVLHEVRGERRQAQDSYRSALNLDERYAPARFNLRQSVEEHVPESFVLAEMKRPDATDKWVPTDWNEIIKKGA